MSCFSKVYFQTAKHLFRPRDFHKLSKLLIISTNSSRRYFSADDRDESKYASTKNPDYKRLISNFELDRVDNHKEQLQSISKSILDSSKRFPIHANLVTYYKSHLDKLTFTLFTHSEAAFSNDVKILCLNELFNKDNKLAPYQILADYDDVLSIRGYVQSHSFLFLTDNYDLDDLRSHLGLFPPVDDFKFISSLKSTDAASYKLAIKEHVEHFVGFTACFITLMRQHLEKNTFLDSTLLNIQEEFTFLLESIDKDGLSIYLFDRLNSDVDQGSSLKSAFFYAYLLNRDTFDANLSGFNSFDIDFLDGFSEIILFFNNPKDTLDSPFCKLDQKTSLIYLQLKMIATSNCMNNLSILDNESLHKFIFKYLIFELPLFFRFQELCLRDEGYEIDKLNKDGLGIEEIVDHFKLNYNKKINFMYRFIEYYDKVSSSESISFFKLAPKIISCCSDGKKDLANNELLFILDEILDYLSNTECSAKNIFNVFYKEKTAFHKKVHAAFDVAQEFAASDTLILIESILDARTKADLIQLFRDQKVFFSNDLNENGLLPYYKFPDDFFEK